MLFSHKKGVVGKMNYKRKTFFVVVVLMACFFLSCEVVRGNPDSSENSVGGSSYVSATESSGEVYASEKDSVIDDVSSEQKTSDYIESSFSGSSSESSESSSITDTSEDSSFGSGTFDEPVGDEPFPDDGWSSGSSVDSSSGDVPADYPSEDSSFLQPGESSSQSSSYYESSFDSSFESSGSAEIPVIETLDIAVKTEPLVTVSWEASEEIAVFDVWIDGQIVKTLTDSVYVVELLPGVYRVEVYGFKEGEADNAAYGTAEIVVKLSSPVITTEEVNGKSRLVWSAVVGADGYRVYKNTEFLRETKDLYYSLSEQGEYSVSAYSIDYPEIDSNLSTAVKYPVASTVTVSLKLNGKVLTRNDPSGVKEYYLYARENGKEIFISSMDSVDYNIALWYRKNKKNYPNGVTIFLRAVLTSDETVESNEVFLSD